ncbi:flagellar biosynthetic protein FliO [Sulfuricystis multivorans]|uniref:flagellar biosynthetic protein FliO n=1 Tax=Sulfuricystis multivorans TaxID=2211108 RepID=UPI0024DFF810|nr:flagellar biosynthetic protein FliO [Sulfuricystis multivorans]
MLPRGFALLSFAFIPLARAAEGGAVSSAPDLGASALSMFFGLIVVLALLIGALWLMKRLGQPHGAAAGLMRVVAGVAVGPRERVVILELGNSWLVLGVAPGQVTTLAEIPRQELPPGVALSTAGEFPDWLKRMVHRREK